MAEAFFIKIAPNTLHTASEHDRALLKKIKIGEPVRMTYKRVRNYAFHKKLFALLEYLYNVWEPPENQVGEKSREQFRSDMIILAGFYEYRTRVDGSTRVVPKSISFSSMDQDTFDQLYSAMIDAGVKHICSNYTGDTLREVVGQVEEFE